MNYIKSFVLTGIISLSLASCMKDLDVEPAYDITSATVYKDFKNYKPILAKVYGGLALSGQQGPSGQPDVFGFDEGKSNYIRAYWQLQELTTDEAIIGWNDGTIYDLHDMDWTTSSEYIRMMYDRIFYQISLCNEFIRETTDAKLGERGIAGADAEEARKFRTEARFLRALSYYHALDMFGNVPFVTENDPVGSFFPTRIERGKLFEFVETELKELESQLVAPKQNEYGRVDQTAAWTLLAKLYLNAEVYIKTPKYAEAITYATKVIGAGYALETTYQNLFLADNNKSKEIIFPVAFDGIRTKSYGGTTFLVHAAIGGTMNPNTYGVSSGWGGLRTTKNLVNLFSNAGDKRAMFYTSGQKLEIDEIPTFSNGYAIAKYKNITSEGKVGTDKNDFPDTDYPMFRLADVYLMYAEATARGGAGGDPATAVGYINNLRERAYGNNSGNITTNDLTLDFILAERGRELFWEGHRRTDLIRFGKFTGAEYVWPWKGGIKEGKGVETWRNLFPIPSFDIINNPNLKQNEGYNQ